MFARHCILAQTITTDERIAVSGLWHALETVCVTSNVVRVNTRLIVGVTRHCIAVQPSFQLYAIELYSITSKYV